VLGLIGVGGIVASAILSSLGVQQILTYAPGAFFALASWGLGGTAVFLWSSKSGKLRITDRIINSIPWRGDEMVLDVGCGRRLMLIGAAKRLTSGGKAVGVDIWNPADQSGNQLEETLENAKIEGVSERE
jgi:hypothetical protein